MFLLTGFMLLISDHMPLRQVDRAPLDHFNTAPLPNYFGLLDNVGYFFPGFDAWFWSVASWAGLGIMPKAPVALGSIFFPSVYAFPVPLFRYRDERYSGDLPFRDTSFLAQVGELVQDHPYLTGAAICALLAAGLYGLYFFGVLGSGSDSPSAEAFSDAVEASASTAVAAPAPKVPVTVDGAVIREAKRFLKSLDGGTSLPPTKVDPAVKKEVSRLFLEAVSAKPAPAPMPAPPVPTPNSSSQAMLDLAKRFLEAPDLKATLSISPDLKARLVERLSRGLVHYISMVNDNLAAGILPQFRVLELVEKIIQAMAYHHTKPTCAGLLVKALDKTFEQLARLDYKLSEGTLKVTRGRYGLPVTPENYRELETYLFSVIDRLGQLMAETGGVGLS